ncbi:PTS sugar transporter subunit IIA [[Pasteurella] aerogenes]
MLKFTQMLSPENLRQGVVCSSKKRAFETICHIVAKQLCEQSPQQEQEATPAEQCEEQEEACFESLLAREKLGNSSLGNGVALPKARLSEDRTTPTAVFLQLETPIDYDSADHREVDLIFALFIPPELCDQYTQELPSLTEKLTDKSLCKQLRAAKSEDELWQIFQHADNITQEEVEMPPSLLDETI